MRVIDGRELCDDCAVEYITDEHKKEMLDAFCDTISEEDEI